VCWTYLAGVTSPAEAAGTAPTDGLASGIVSLRATLPRGLVVLLGAAAIVVVAAGIRSVAWLIGPAFLALIIVIAVAPVQNWFRRRGLPRWLVTLVLVVAVEGVMLLLALAIVISIARLATALPQYAGQSQQLVQSATAALARFGVGPDELRQVVEALDLGKLSGLLAAFLGSVAGIATNLIFILTLLVFLSVETGTAGSRVAEIASDRPEIGSALANFAHNTRQYLLVSTVFGLIVAVLDTIALAIIGIPLAVTWGVLSFVTNYIPNIGFVLGLIPPALLGLLIGGPQQMLLVIVLYSVLNFVVQSLIQPRFVGDAVGLSVTVTFLSLAFWTWLVGPLGAILAIPLTLLAKALLVDVDPRARWADALLRSTTRPSGGGAHEQTISTNPRHDSGTQSSGRGEEARIPNDHPGAVTPEG
jgi:AI-2 transport protein TqsA